MDKLRIGLPVVHTDKGVGLLLEINGEVATVDFNPWATKYHPEMCRCSWCQKGIQKVAVTRLKSRTATSVRFRNEHNAYRRVSSAAEWGIDG